MTTDKKNDKNIGKELFHKLCVGMHCPDSDTLFICIPETRRWEFSKEIENFPKTLLIVLLKYCRIFFNDKINEIEIVNLFNGRELPERLKYERVEKILMDYSTKQQKHK